MFTGQKRVTLICRSNRGGVLALVLAVIGIFLLACVIFSLNLVRLLGTNQEQRTAIEAAALAAAVDLSKIVIEDKHFGFVGLSDAGPVGKATRAGDNYFMPVRNINSILGTIRLQAIIAGQLNDPVMRDLVRRDYGYAMNAKDKLVATLKTAVQPNCNCVDADGNTVRPYEDAIKAYETNQVRMTGKKSVRADTMKLTLGYAADLPTNTPVPMPESYAPVSDDKKQSGCYKAYINFPFDTMNFVFAGTLDNAIILSGNEFLETAPNGVPYAIPSVIKCECDQEYDGSQGQQAKFRVHASACAVPGVSELLPLPGALVISFPDGAPGALTKPRDFFTDVNMTNSPADVLESPLTNDFLPGPLSNIDLPVIGEHPFCSRAISFSLFDWLRRAGPKLNIKHFMDMLDSSFAQGSGGVAHRYVFNKTGGVDYTPVAIQPDFVLPVSHVQYQLRSKFAVKDKNSFYDVFLRDFVYQPGRMQGGNHGGEPLTIRDYAADYGNNPAPAPTGSNNARLDLNPTVQFPQGSGAGQIRPTVSEQAIAVEIRFRLRS